MSSRTLTKALILLLGLSLLSCRKRLVPASDDYVEYGWVLYTDRDFTGAFDEFQTGLDLDSMYIDGYNGLGWIYVEWELPDSAIYFFDRGISLVQDDSSQVLDEMLAGMAYSYHRQGDYVRAISRGSELYTLNPVFEFSHDWRINFEDIIILVAASHFAAGQFSQSLVWVRRLDPEFNVDVTTNIGRAELAHKIELLQNL